MDFKWNLSQVTGIVLTSTLVLTGCQKAGEAGGSIESSSELSMACKTQNEIDPDSLAIQGNSVIQAGAVAHYKLNQEVGCSEGEKISWNKMAANSKSEDGQVLTTSFNKPGQYVITAKVESVDSSGSMSKSTEGLMVSTKTTVVGSNFALNGPEYGMAQIPANFSLAIPAGVTVTSVTWTFGDGTAAQTGTGAKAHIYRVPGIYNVNVNIVTSTGTASISQAINIIQLLDGFECLDELAISGPNNAVVGNPVALSAYIPLCVSSRLSGVVWNFGDGTTATSGQSVSHVYANPGAYNVSLAISVLGVGTNPMFTLTHTVIVNSREIEEPTPPNPMACPTAGQTREIVGESYTQEATCGVQGKRTDIYHDRVTMTCSMNATTQTLLWSETARSKELISQGTCKGEACELPAEAFTGVDVVSQNVITVGGKRYLTSGSRLTFYSSQLPEAACSTVEQSRTCTDGVLNGSSNFKFLLCTNGCAGVGAHGTVKTDVVVGEVSVPKVCAFGETGITDLFNQVADKTCNNGQVTSSATRLGGIKTAGVCPVYSWVPTETFSACSAACGGEQSRLYICRDGNGNQAPSERCVTPAPVDKVVCDGDPESVKRTDVVTTTQDGGSQNQCPASQIGVIVKTRESTVTTQYACVNHHVQQVNQTVAYGPWEEENYCREFVGFRCSQDSLDNKGAAGRYLWMKKCASSVAVIKEFLDKFDNVEVDSRGHDTNNGLHLGANGRVLYPTFMNREGKNKHGVKCEKPWIAPTDPSESCNVPSTVYVAAVCVSSCATPEQQILAQEKANDKLAYNRFDQAWQKKFAYVATLQSKSSMSAKRVQKTKVDQWVTEMVDTEHVILEFRMKSGGQLRLTQNHPLLGADAMMHQAQDFKVGESLVLLGGVKDEIVSITQSKYYGKVYNVFVKSADLHKNIVVTNGYLNGTAMYQNEAAKHMNTKIFRNSLIRGVFSK